MIRDLSESLKAILMQPGAPPELAGAQFSFDRPVETFNPAQPTINLFLYEIRENPELRFNQASVDRQNGVARITPPPKRIVCSYLVTAWVNSGTDVALQEHRLLTQAVGALSKYAIIPPELAVNSIKKCDPPVSMQVATSNTAVGISEFWSALGARMRPSISVQATIALPTQDEAEAPLVKTSRVVMGERSPHPNLSLLPGTGEISNPQSLYGRVVRRSEKIEIEGESYFVARQLDANRLVLAAYEHPPGDIAGGARYSLVIPQGTFELGTIAYTSATRQVMLSGATWPLITPRSTIVIDAQEYGIESRVSDAILSLLPGSSPGADIAPGKKYRVHTPPTRFNAGQIEVLHNDRQVTLTGAQWPPFLSPLEPLSDVEVWLVEKNWRVLTGTDGIFRFGKVAPGQYTLRLSYRAVDAETQHSVPTLDSELDIQLG